MCMCFFNFSTYGITLGTLRYVSLSCSWSRAAEIGWRNKTLSIAVQSSFEMKLRVWEGADKEICGRVPRVYNG